MLHSGSGHFGAIYAYVQNSASDDHAFNNTKCSNRSTICIKMLEKTEQKWLNSAPLQKLGQKCRSLPQRLRLQQFLELVLHGLAKSQSSQHRTDDVG